MNLIVVNELIVDWIEMIVDFVNESESEKIWLLPGVRMTA